MASPDNSTSDNFEMPNNVAEATILFITTAFGCVGNIAAMIVIIACRRYRKSSTAFICHQCFLDFIKSLYCLLYGYHLLHEKEVPSCHAVGASYVFFVTVSAYNLLAIVVNEEYEFQSPPAGNNQYCVLFGICTIWFMCLLMNMGVAFLPKEPEFIPEIGNCIFLYGTPSNFVLHILWMVLVSMAIFMSLTHFISMYFRIRYKALSLHWSTVHNALIKENQQRSFLDDSREEEAIRNTPRRNRYYTHLYLKRVTILLLMVTSFIVFWYPLFILTMVDYQFKQPKQAYRILTVLSWCHSATTPIFVLLILVDTFKKDGILRRIYSNEHPMMPFLPHTDDPPRAPPLPDLDTGMFNNYFDPDLQELDMEETLLINVLPNVTRDAPSVEAEVKIERYDSSPRSPGKRLKLDFSTAVN